MRLCANIYLDVSKWFLGASLKSLHNENEVNPVGTDLQKASIWKRLAAWLFDAILVCVLAVGFAFLLSLATGYDGHNQTLQETYDRYEAQYGVTFDITEEEYNQLDAAKKEAYDTAYQTLVEDDEVLYIYNLVLNLSLLILTLSILLAFLALEFVVPLLLKNGQTVGKKIFGLGLVRADSVRMTPLQLFIRTLLGKYTIETMIPVYIIFMILWSMLDATGTVILIALLVGQVAAIGISRTNGAIHDLLAGTVVVDIASQQVFASTEELIAYTKRIHAEKAARQDY